MNSLKKWLIVIDLDGTTLMSDGASIHPYTIKSVRKLISLGHYVCINTGRGYYSSRLIYKTLNLKHLISCSSGNIIFDYENKTKPILNYMNCKLIYELINEPYVKSKILAYAFEDFKQTYLSENNEKLFLYCHGENKKTYKIIENEKFSKGKYNISTFFIQINGVENIEKIYNYFSNTNKFMVYKIYVNKYFNVSTNDVFIELNNIEKNKGDALKYFISYYNIENNYICIGDSENDIKMFKFAGINHSVALNNAPNVVKKYCKHITNNNANEGGLGLFLNNFFNLIN